MYQVVVAGEVVDANVDAEEDLTFRIPAADFMEILLEAGVPEEAVQELQVRLYGAGYGRALPWVNPVRTELAAQGIGSGFIDGIVAETKKYLLDSVGVAYLQALVGGGDTAAGMVKTLSVCALTPRTRYPQKKPRAPARIHHAPAEPGPSQGRPPAL